MSNEHDFFCGTPFLHYANEISGAIPDEKDRGLLMKYAFGGLVPEQDQKRFAKLRRIIIDKRNEERIQTNEERIKRCQKPYPFFEYDQPK